MQGEHAARIYLDLHQVSQYTIFPGQIIAVEGVIAQSRGGQKTVKVGQLYGSAPVGLAMLLHRTSCAFHGASSDAESVRSFR